jgi:zinc transport system permease protein
MMLAIAVTVVSSIRLVGIMLLMSMLTIPQMTAALFVHRMSSLMALSAGLCLIGCVVGLFFSYSLNIPSGAAIIFVQVFMLTVSKLCMSICKKSDF